MDEQSQEPVPPPLDAMPEIQAQEMAAEAANPMPPPMGMCEPVTSLEQAMMDIPNSMLPITGLRRDEMGNLTPDALSMVIDGLKSRGMDPTDPAQKGVLLKELNTLLCNTNNQYQFLLAELSRRMDTGEPIDTGLLGTARTKNLAMTDMMNVAQFLEEQKPMDQSTTFVEGWQTMGASRSNSAAGFRTYGNTVYAGFQNQLTMERRALESRSLDQLKRQSLLVTQEKNRVANNYLGLYGFLNLVAIGLLVYVAGASNGSR